MAAGKLIGGYPAQSALRTFINFSRKALIDNWDIATTVRRMGAYEPESALIMTIDRVRLAQCRTTDAGMRQKQFPYGFRQVGSYLVRCRKPVLRPLYSLSLF